MFALLKSNDDRSAVSLTGYYTGQVWVENKLSPPRLGTTMGRWMYRLMRPLDRASNRLQGVSLETMLLQRHLGIDHLLGELMGRHKNLQIVEIGCGLSARAWRCLNGQIVPLSDAAQIGYLEADLPDVVAFKRRLYAGMGASNPLFSGDRRHELRSCNILRNGGDLSMESLLARLDPERPVLVITEGVVNYFPFSTMQAFWRRLATSLGRFPQGYYVSDIWPRLPDYKGLAVRRWAVSGLELMTRQPVPLHFDDHRDILQGFASYGFAQTRLFDPDQDFPVAGQPVMEGKSLFRLIKAQRHPG